jgi:hypothetical protein
MAQENWKDVLKSQKEDLERLEAMDAALNETDITDSINKILKKPIRTDVNLGHGSGERAPAPAPPMTGKRISSNVPPPAFAEERNIRAEVALDEEESLGGASSTTPRNKVSLAPETADRCENILFPSCTGVYTLKILLHAYVDC